MYLAYVFVTQRFDVVCSFVVEINMFLFTKRVRLLYGVILDQNVLPCRQFAILFFSKHPYASDMVLRHISTFNLML